MIKELDDHAIEYGWVGADSLYGKNYEFRDSSEKLGKKFVVDIPEDHHVYLECPDLYLPEKKSSWGRSVDRYTADSVLVTVQQCALQAEEKEWKLINYQQGTKQSMKAFYLAKTVWMWRLGDTESKKYTLIIKKT